MRLFHSSSIRRLVESQSHSCAYCLLPFGTVVRNLRGKETVQNPEGDHFIPWAYSEDSSESNLVACCGICNSLKGDRVYETLEDARRDIIDRRNLKQVKVSFLPSTPVTLDPERWAVEYARYLVEG